MHGHSVRDWRRRELAAPTAHRFYPVSRPGSRVCAARLVPLPRDPLMGLGCCGSSTSTAFLDTLAGQRDVMPGPREAADMLVRMSVSSEAGGPPNRRSFFFNDTATTEIYTLSLHDALPI